MTDHVHEPGNVRARRDVIRHSGSIVVLPLDLTGGGPLNSTEVLSLRLYREGFQYYNIGTASAITLVLVGLDLLLSWVYFRMIRAEAYYR